MDVLSAIQNWVEYKHVHALFNRIQNHGPINHVLATPFLNYIVTLNARKTRDFIRDLIINGQSMV